MTVTDWQDDLSNGGSIVDGTVVEVRPDGWAVIEYQHKGKVRRVLFHSKTGQIEAVEK